MDKLAINWPNYSQIQLPLKYTFRIRPLVINSYIVVGAVLVSIGTSQLRWWYMSRARLVHSTQWVVL